MDKILHQLISSSSHYLQGFIHPWCRISSINSSKYFLLSMMLMLLLPNVFVFLLLCSWRLSPSFRASIKCSLHCLYTMISFGLFCAVSCRFHPFNSKTTGVFSLPSTTLEDFCWRMPCAMHSWATNAKLKRRKVCDNSRRTTGFFGWSAVISVVKLQGFFSFHPYLGRGDDPIWLICL